MAGYEKHLHTIHFDIVLSLCGNADLTRPGPPGSVHDENINQSHSEYKSDQRLEIADCRTASSEIDHDM